MNDFATLVDRYRTWLRDRTTIKQIGDWTEITTPFIDRHNDFIQIYARGHNGGYELTDDGATLADLEMSGCRLDTPKRQALLKMVLNGFGVQLNDDSLVVHATADNFPLKKHNLIQAVLAVNDMFFTASATVANLFIEDVAAWLDLSEVRYLPKVKLTGRSGFDHIFDFAIPHSRKQPERLLRAISNPSREKAENFAFAWLDTRDTRQQETQALALLNDGDRPIASNVSEALSAYEIRSVPWSDRDSVRELLAA
jgi:hypothetical protein